MVNNDTVRDGDESAPPPPPPPPPSSATSGPAAPAPTRRPGAAHGPVRAGQLTFGWRVATGAVWALVVVGFVAVWKTSRELGLNTWWLGPWGEPQPAYVTMLPFVAPIAMIVLAVNSLRGLPFAGLAAAALTGLIATFDVHKVPRLALVEFAIAGAGALTSIAGLAGRYRPASGPVASPGDD